MKERIGKRRWTAIAIAVFGVLFIASHTPPGSGALLGAVLAILGGACWAAGSVLAKKFDRGDDLLN